MVYTCMHGLALRYLAVDCVSVTSLVNRRHLRSAESGSSLSLEQEHALGTRDFAVTGAKIWNSLSADL